MGPKKEAKGVVEEAPKEPEPEPPAHELTGYGRFEYLSGVKYEGNWKLKAGIKVKQGYGMLIVPSSLPEQIGQESYEGNWEDDRMEGVGTYLYPDGSIYEGEWRNNQQHGRGVFHFSNGTRYEGEWKNHLMDGSGWFRDHLGREWKGEFRAGVFESRKQVELVREIATAERKNSIKSEIQTTLKALIQAVEKSDERTLSNNLSPYLIHSQNAPKLLTPPYAKPTDISHPEWAQTLQLARTGKITILPNAQQSSVLPKDRILQRQMQGRGQIVEITATKEDKTAKLALLQVEEGRWLLAHIAQK